MQHPARFSLFLIILAIFFVPNGTLAEDYRDTLTLDNIVEYTIYSKGSMTISEDKRTHTHYPSDGGIIKVQYSTMNSNTDYDELYAYSVAFPAFKKIMLDVLYQSNQTSEKELICGGYYALRLSFDYIGEENDAISEEAYLILTPKHVIVLRFISSDAIGSPPIENVLYTLASLKFL